MRKAELIAAAFFFLAGAHVVQQSTSDLDMWSRYGPGPGFVPFWAGALWMVLSALHMLNVVLQPRIFHGSQPFPVGVSAVRVIVLTAILAVSIFLMETVGFLVAMTVMIALCLAIIDRYSWKKTAVASVVIAATCYAVFSAVIGVPFPRGILGI